MQNLVPIESKSGLVQIAKDIWIIEAIEHPTENSCTTQNTTLIRLKDGKLFVILPTDLSLDPSSKQKTQLDQSLKADIDKIGPTKYLISLSPTYDLNQLTWSQLWRQNYPNAKIYTLSELANTSTTDSPREKQVAREKQSENKQKFEWAEEIEQHIFSTNSLDPDREQFSEILFFHIASRTVTLIDTGKGSSQAASNISQPYSQQVLKTIQQWEPECIVIPHSTLPYTVPYIEGKEEVSSFLNNTFNSLNPTPAVVGYTIDAAKLITAVFFTVPVYLFVALATDIAYPQLAKWMITFISRSTDTKDSALIEKAQ